MPSRIHISVVIPVYGCEECLTKLYIRLCQTLQSLTENFEIIMVNDASPDSSWEAIKKLSEEDSRVKGISLSRNFGQSKAITAGLDYADGDWIIVMDCDLQDQPEEITKLYSKVNEGYDIVFGKRFNRRDSFFKKMRSNLYFVFYNYFTDSNTDSRVSNFSIISKKVLKAFKMYREHNPAYTLSVNLLGFKRAEIDIEHAEREDGKSSYSLKKLIDIAIDAIVSQSNKPLSMAIKFGFIISFLSFIASIWLVGKYYMYGVEIEGWTSVMVSLYFIAGLIFINLGFVGLYIGKIFNETKSRPLYLIDQLTWEEDTSRK
jgi:glycosyltransferase involved in cell wall biosynthesis